jgi:pimeloyl-ACP methyl ester carboxylesterase
MIIEVNRVSLYVEDHGEGTPVLLIRGWPDSARLWRHQIPFLTGHGCRHRAGHAGGARHFRRDAEECQATEVIWKC